jgi:hypothetical protein
VAGLVGVVVLAGIWLAQGLFDELAWAPVFGLLLAPIGASIGALTGLLVGGLSRWFGSFVNAASFGGLLGSGLGAMAALSLFAGDPSLSPLFAAVISLAITGAAVATGVKYLIAEKSPRFESPSTQDQ